MGRLLAELAAFGLAIGFSPLHIALLLLLLLGPQPLRRGGWLVLVWLTTTTLVLVVLLSLGHGLLLTMAKGSNHRTGLDLVGAGALLALGLKALRNSGESGAPPAWTGQLERFCARPLPLLLAISAGLQLASPDDLFLLARTAGSLLAAGLNTGQEVVATAVFGLMSAQLLLLPLLALALLGAERVQPLLQRSRDWLFARGDLLVGLVSLALAGYLGWQGVEGLNVAQI